MKIFLQLLLQIVLIGLNAFFACAEIAVLSVSEASSPNWRSRATKKPAALPN